MVSIITTLLYQCSMEAATNSTEPFGHWRFNFISFLTKCSDERASLRWKYRDQETSVFHFIASRFPHPNSLLWWCKTPGRCQHIILPRSSLEVQWSDCMGLVSHCKYLFHSFPEPLCMTRKTPVTGEKAKKCPPLFSLPWLPFPARCCISMGEGTPRCVLARACLWSLTNFSSHSQIWLSLPVCIYE